MGKVTIPEKYHSCLSSYETQEAIGIIKNLMQKKLCLALNLKRVTAPVFVDPASGLNDDLNGVERPVTFDIPDANMNAQVVHSWQNGNVWPFTALIFMWEKESSAI